MGSVDAAKRLEGQLKGMDGVTSVVRTANQEIKVNSGLQLRLTVDISEQIPQTAVAKEIDFTVQEDLKHSDADPFLATEGGKSQHPWTQTSTAQMRSPQAQQQAVKDESS